MTLKQQNYHFLFNFLSTVAIELDFEIQSSNKFFSSFSFLGPYVQNQSIFTNSKYHKQ